MTNFRFFLTLIVSFFLVGFAQPDWSILLCVIAGAMGFALFWKAAFFLKKKKARFWLATFWFMGIQFIQLSWFLSDKYVGWPIFIFLGVFTFCFGIQFGLVSLVILTEKPLGLFRILVASCLWVIMEWSRLKLLTGYSWNPIGILFSATTVSMQLASVLGVFGLSFWIFFTNLLAFKFLTQKLRGSFVLSWVVIALFPYLFGWGILKFHEKSFSEENNELRALLVQTALLPEEKLPISGDNHSRTISPYNQWRRILSLLHIYQGETVDLIVFPEAALPYGPYTPLYSPDQVREAFFDVFGVEDDSFLPTPEFSRVGNRYFARALANFFNADVIIGLEEVTQERKAYNAAFLFPPKNLSIARYEKRVLVPMGEYIPFEWCRKILKWYGIEDSFTPGESAKIFQCKKGGIGCSICYEETYGSLMRENRQLGADLLVNLSNDVWYPRSRLPIVHCFHGRLRSVEEGIPLLRACNTGVTCAIDSLGRTVGILPYDNHRATAPAETLYVPLPLYKYSTLYTFYGDIPVVSASFGIVGIFFLSLLFHKLRSGIPITINDP